MRPRSFTLLLLALLFSLYSATAARGADRVDAYFGYSRAGANLYAPYTPGMNGWQAAGHYRPIPFVGVEGDVSHFSQSSSAYSDHVTLVMFGPRVTVRAKGFSMFAHALGGFNHESETLTIYPQIKFNAGSYALGGGADVPLVVGLKLRVTGDYLGNSNAPGSEYSPSHYRAGVGLAYHF